MALRSNMPYVIIGPQLIERLTKHATKQNTHIKSVVEFRNLCSRVNSSALPNSFEYRGVTFSNIDPLCNA